MPKKSGSLVHISKSTLASIGSVWWGIHKGTPVAKIPKLGFV